MSFLPTRQKIVEGLIFDGDAVVLSTQYDGCVTPQFLSTLFKLMLDVDALGARVCYISSEDFMALWCPVMLDAVEIVPVANFVVGQVVVASEECWPGEI